MSPAPATLERMYSLRELADAGYGDRRTITKMIHDSRVPAVKISNTFKVRERDLQFIGTQFGGPSSAVAPAQPAPAADLTDGLGDYVQALVGPSRVSMLPRRPLSVACWARPHSGPQKERPRRTGAFSIIFFRLKS